MIADMSPETEQLVYLSTTRIGELTGTPRLAETEINIHSSNTNFALKVAGAG
jgi:hypothetical protein